MTQPPSKAVKLNALITLPVLQVWLVLDPSALIPAPAAVGCLRCVELRIIIQYVPAHRDSQEIHLLDVYRHHLLLNHPYQRYNPFNPFYLVNLSNPFNPFNSFNRFYQFNPFNPFIPFICFQSIQPFQSIQSIKSFQSI